MFDWPMYYCRRVIELNNPLQIATEQKQRRVEALPTLANNANYDGDYETEANDSDSSTGEMICLIVSHALSGESCEGKTDVLHELNQTKINSHYKSRSRHYTEGVCKE